MRSYFRELFEYWADENALAAAHALVRKFGKEGALVVSHQHLNETGKRTGINWRHVRRAILDITALEVDYHV